MNFDCYNKSVSLRIKEKAIELGFSACGIAKAEVVSSLTQKSYLEWLEKERNGSMEYLNRNVDKRFNPQLLVPGAQSIIVVAMNYLQEEKQSHLLPQRALFSYGKDYHHVLKEKLYTLLQFIHNEISPVQGRAFVDSAPILERYWGKQSGIGYMGRNGQLIVPGKGSYFFLGELIIDLPLATDAPLSQECPNECRLCIQACPTKAISSEEPINAERCISYQTIENHCERIDPFVCSHLGNKFFGCDNCQTACPENQNASIENTLFPAIGINISYEDWLSMTEPEFNQRFKGTTLERAGYKQILRNIKSLKTD